MSPRYFGADLYRVMMKLNIQKTFYCESIVHNHWTQNGNKNGSNIVT